MTRKDYLNSVMSYGRNCYCCGQKNEGYMLHDSIWKSVSKREERRHFLCITCVEQRLNRKLKISDFICAPINNGFFGFNAQVYTSLEEDNGQN